MGHKVLNVIFCGIKDEDRAKSWGKTNSFLINQIKNQVNLVGYIDYSIHSRFWRILHRLYCWIFIGEQSSRDGFICYLMERKFQSAFRKLHVPVDIFIHSSGMCVPEKLIKEGLHVLYIDATIMGAMKYNNVRFNPKHAKVFEQYTKKYLDRYAVVFTFNEWTKHSLINDFDRDPGKIHNIGFGANLDPYEGKKNYSNGLIITVLRRGLEKNKGLYLLLEGFRIARSRNHKLRLAVVGTELSPEEGVEYYENQPRINTIQLFREASLFVLPALFEPNGMVYPEALANKTPIVGLNRLAFPEFSRNGEYGFIINSPDPACISETLLEALADPERLEKMGREGQQFAMERYNWQSVAEKMVKISSRMLGS